MSDRYYTKIEIGGKLQRIKVPVLFQAARDDGMEYEFSEGEVQDEKVFLEAAEEAVQKNQPLQLYDPGAAWGNLESLEKTCRRLRLPFRKLIEGGYGNLPVVEYWQPEMRESNALDSTEGAADPLIRYSQLVKFIRRAKSLPELTLWLQKRYRVPRLPPLTLV